MLVTALHLSSACPADLPRCQQMNCAAARTINYSVDTHLLAFPFEKKKSKLWAMQYTEACASEIAFGV